MKRSSLLINEPPLQFSPSLAEQIGLNEAIVMQQLNYWLLNPKCQGYVDENGDKWIYNSYEEWQADNFPFWSIQTVQRAFLSLEKMGVVITAQFWANKRDMRKFYRIDRERLDNLDGIKLTSSDGIKLRSSIISKRHDVNKESETTQGTNKSLSDDVPDFENMSVHQAYKLPTLRLYRDATGFFPGQAVWQFVHEFITENKITKAKLESAFAVWKRKGFKTENVEGILEWARDGIPDVRQGAITRKPGATPANPAVFEGTKRFLQRHEGENGNG